MAGDGLAAEIQPNGVLIEPSPQPLADIRSGHRVQRSRDLDVVIGMHFYVGPARNIERCIRRWSKMLALFGLEHFTRNAAGRAVNPRASDLGAPLLGRRPQ